MSDARLRRPPWGWIVLGLLLGAVAAAVFIVREPAAALTREELERARERWRAERPAAYLLEVETGGSLEARHRIEVRGGEVVGMTTGGAEASAAAWEYWSVDGLFGFLETELENAGRSQEAYGVAPDAVVLRARFHPRWGYPEFFLRHVMGRRQAIEWRVLRFDPSG